MSKEVLNGMRFGALLVVTGLHVMVLVFPQVAAENDFLIRMILDRSELTSDPSPNPAGRDGHRTYCSNPSTCPESSKKPAPAVETHQ